MAPSLTSFTAAALLAVAPAARAQSLGTFSVKNGCSQAIKLSVTKGAEMPQDLGEIQPNQSSEKFNYEVMPEGFGVNYAICPSDKDLDKSMLFEYSIHGGRIWYDLSNIVVSDEYPELFQNGGISIIPAKPHESACSPVTCPAGQDQCKAAYWQSNDNWAVHNCAQNQDTVLETCSSAGDSEDADTSDTSGQGSSGGSGGYGGSAPQAPSYSDLSSASSSSPPVQAQAYGGDSGDNSDNMVQQHDGTPYVEDSSQDNQQQGGNVVTTVVVGATETKYIQARDTGMAKHRRHMHGHGHHHA